MPLADDASISDFKLRRRAAWTGIGLLAMALVGFACAVFGLFGAASATPLVSGLGSLAFAVAALCCCLVVVRATRGRRRMAWWIMSLGLLGWVVGDVVRTVGGLSHGTALTSGSFIDAAYLLLPVATCLAWSVNAPAEGRFLAVRPMLDGIIVAAALFVAFYFFTVDDMWDRAAVGPGVVAVALAYPVLDIIAVTMAVVVLSHVSAPHRRTVGAVTAGLAVIALADSSRVYYLVQGRPTTALLIVAWAAGLVLISTGALLAPLTPRVTSSDRRIGRNLFWLPYVPIPGALIICLWTMVNYDGVDDQPILVAGALMTFAVLVRQFMVLGENRALLQTIAEQTLRDPLTGLGNRVLFSDRLAHAMDLRSRDSRDVSVVSLDLDDFKLVNDNLGHQWGDDLLRLVAARLLTAVRPGDTIARLGGDEFAILIEEGDEEAEHVARRVLEAFDDAFLVDGEELYVYPSVGLATASGLDGEPVSAEELLQRADLAMYSAKRVGVGGVQRFTSDMQMIDRTELRSSLSDVGKRRNPVAGVQLLGQLRRAIDDDALSLLYQPKVSLATGDVVGVEALVRWPHAEFGLLAPDQFLPLVRQHGLMGAVTDLVLSRAVGDAAAWSAGVVRPLPVAVNLFAPLLNDLTLPDRIGAALDRGGLPPSALTVEITEHLLVSDVGRARRVIERLRTNGLRVAIDDFGTGYATMGYLRDLPVDELKLDHHFIAPVLQDERASAIVHSVIELAHVLGIVCVAEGVEDQATADRLREYGCDVAQGHLFSRPMTVDALCEQLRCSTTQRTDSRTEPSVSG